MCADFWKRELWSRLFFVVVLLAATCVDGLGKGIINYNLSWCIKLKAKTERRKLLRWGDKIERERGLWKFQVGCDSFRSFCCLNFRLSQVEGHFLMEGRLTWDFWPIILSSGWRRKYSVHGNSGRKSWETVGIGSFIYAQQYWRPYLH